MLDLRIPKAALLALASCSGSLLPCNAFINTARAKSSAIITLNAANPVDLAQSGLPLVDKSMGSEPVKTFELDYTKPPPFTLADLKAAIPAHLWEKDAVKSMSYVAKDVSIVLALALAAYTIDFPLLWPLYWFAQGTMFWALFVLGHDCGHGSFSNDKKLNDFVGHLTHASILVPYHGWRISHRTHHANHGHIDNDESWYPMSKSEYDEIDPAAKIARFTLAGALIAYPIYLWKRTPGRKAGSHFNPTSAVFEPPLATDKERAGDVMESTLWYAGMVAVLAFFTGKLGLGMMTNLYFIPYLINVMWLDVVTYLHHTTPDLPWYRGSQWSYLRGALTARDHDYGIINDIHHNIGTHMVHHIFPQIPHYNIKAATEAIKPILGPYYKEPEKSAGPLPVHLYYEMKRGMETCNYVEDEGEVVYYKAEKKQE